MWKVPESGDDSIFTAAGYPIAILLPVVYVPHAGYKRLIFQSSLIFFLREGVAVRKPTYSLPTLIPVCATCLLSIFMSTLY